MLVRLTKKMILRFTSLKAEFEEQLKEEAELNNVILENLAKIELKDDKQENI
jgi:hypothetical protein